MSGQGILSIGNKFVKFIKSVFKVHNNKTTSPPFVSIKPSILCNLTT